VTPAIAVIAVHGVADQQPFDTVTAATDLLRGRFDKYAWVAQEDLRIPVRAVSTTFKAASSTTPARTGVPSPIAGAPRYTPEALERAIAKRGTTARESAAHAVEPRAETADVPLEIRDMRERFSGYEPAGADAHYQTRRIELRRELDCNCHVYEMYWADLSRPQMWVVANFVAFYQLLFFMCDLGARAVDYAMASYGTSPGWHAFKWINRVAHIILVLGIPLLNLALLGFAASGVLTGFFLKSGLPGTLVGQAVGILAAVLVATAVFKNRRAFPVAAWPWLFLLVSALGIALAIGLRIDLLWAAPLVIWLVMAVLVAWAAFIYERRRRGAFLTGALFIGSISASYIRSLERGGWDTSGPALFQAQLDVFLLHIKYPHWSLWIGLAVSTLACLTISSSGLLRARLGERSKRHAVRAAATANLTLAVSSVLVLATDLGLWQAIVLAAGRLPFDLALASYRSQLDQTFSFAIPVGVYWGSLVFLLATLFAAWLLLPAIVSEHRRLDDAPRLGRTVSLALRQLRWSGIVIEIIITVGLIAGGILWISSWYTLEGRAADARAMLVVGIVVFVLFSVRQAGAALRSVLDVALDVANWLRHDPRARTPSARIAARFASLLRHVAAWRDPLTGAGYRAVVIVAHSQGTVITADLFRYFKYVDEPELPPNRSPERRVPVYLFTMGNPLWQLYGLRFPDQYGWVRDDAPPAGDFTSHPDPNELSVDVWSNFYRSGDYVGRSLWHADADGDTTRAWEPALRVDGRKRERCIGAGGHTHYWDGTAPAIADELDFLIGEACRAARSAS
jgi:hypothetical protein